LATEESAEKKLSESVEATTLVDPEQKEATMEPQPNSDPEESGATNDDPEEVDPKINVSNTSSSLSATAPCFDLTKSKAELQRFAETTQLVTPSPQKPVETKQDRLLPPKATKDSLDTPETYYTDKYVFSTPPVTDSLDDMEKQRRKQQLAVEQQKMILQRVQDKRNQRHYHNEHTHQQRHKNRFMQTPVPKHRPRTNGLLYRRLSNGKLECVVDE
jgi:hypothetical protein